MLALLGSGGMGEVYRAKDTRLGRDVAVKVLPDAFTKDADRLRRFEQEARTIAALNHPNILGIHDIGTHDGRPYLVSELLVVVCCRGCMLPKGWNSAGNRRVAGCGLALTARVGCSASVETKERNPG